MIKDAIVRIVDKQNLSYDETYQMMDEIMDRKTTAVQNATFLAALSTKKYKDRDYRRDNWLRGSDEEQRQDRL